MTTQHQQKRKSSQVDARHALRLVDAMEQSSSDPLDRLETPTEPSVSRPVLPASSQLKSALRPKPNPQTLPSPPEGGFVSIVSLECQDKGQTVTVSLAWQGAGGEEQRADVKILWTSYEEMSLSMGETTPQCIEEILRAGQLYMAVLQSMTYLGYGSMSRRRLEQKLTAKGFDRELASLAVVYVAECGYLDESDTAMRFAERGMSKSWGPRRIKEDLFARGFPTSVVAEVMETLEEVDFVTPCIAYIKKRYGSVPKDPATRRKMAAALMRMGYTAEIIAKAMER